MKKIISTVLAAVMIITVFAGLNITAFASTQTPENGWYQGDNGVWYYFEKGSVVKSDWRQIKGKWYYFDEDGWMFQSCAEVIKNAAGNENVYVFDKNGAMYTNGWAKVVETYKSGSETITYTIWYYVRPSGTAYTDCWKKVGGKWYFFDDDGWMIENGVYEVNDKLYAFDTSGAWIDTWGWAKFEYKYYDSDDEKWITETEWAYILKDGTCKRGWMHFHNKWYYLDENWGSMYSDGIFRIGGSNIMKSVMSIDSEDMDYGKLYAFDKDGVMLSNQWYKGTEGGSHIIAEPIVNSVFTGPERLNSYFPYEPQWYYLGADGAAVSGWKQIKNVWYYFVPNGGLCTMVTGPALIGKNGINYDESAKPYFFLDSGAMAANRWCKMPYYDVDSDKTFWAYAGANGILYTGWKQIKGDWYYFGTFDDGDAYCIMMTGWLDLDDGTYYLGTDGKMVKGAQVIDGTEYEFDSNGRLISEPF